MKRSNSLDRSPSFLISQMGDPSIVSKLCKSFIKTEIAPESFGSNFVNSALLPQIKSKIVSYDKEALPSLPKLIRLIADNLMDDGIFIIESEILGTIEQCYLQNGDQTYIDLYAEVCSSIPSVFRDETLIEEIDRFAASADSRLRVLAASIISLVRQNQRVSVQFKTLALDKVPKVRVTIIHSLINCNFDAPLTEYVVTHAIKDPSDQVRNAIASIVGNVSPYLFDEYQELLTDSTTTESALRSFAAIVNYHGFMPLYETFLSIIHSYSTTCAQVLIQIAPNVDPSELCVIFQCAKELTTNYHFISNMFTFSQSFKKKSPFLKFFYSEHAKDSKLMLLYAEQAIKFVDDFGEKLLTYAFDIADEDNSQIRKVAVRLLHAIYTKETSTGNEIAKLATGSMSQRIVMAKLIGKIGLTPQFAEATKILLMNENFKKYFTSIMQTNVLVNSH